VRAGIGIDISPKPVRHGQTPARLLRSAGKRIVFQVIVALTVQEILDEHIAKNLA
jgi:hypothetical protein